MPPEMLARITPGPQHAGLAWFLGDWEVESRLVLPGAEGLAPDRSTCRFEWLIEGRWLLSRMKGTLMGAPVEWAHVHGYNNLTQNYETVGFDSTSTDAKITLGHPLTQDGSTLAYFGTMNSVGGRVNKPVRIVQERLDEDRFQSELWDPELGPQGTLVVRSIYTRAKE
jgi:hypothetical protein